MSFKTKTGQQKNAGLFKWNIRLAITPPGNPRNLRYTLLLRQYSEA
jgi:hypothetical protein